MKHVPFVILGIMTVASSFAKNTWGVWQFKPDAIGVWSSLLMMAGYASALFYVDTLQLSQKAFQASRRLHDYISGLEGRIYEIENKPTPATVFSSQMNGRLDRIEKSTVVCMEQITELDRRVSGNDPFGG